MRNRWRSLLSVDDLIDGVVKALDDTADECLQRGLFGNNKPTSLPLVQAPQDVQAPQRQ